MNCQMQRVTCFGRTCGHVVVRSRQRLVAPPSTGGISLKRGLCLRTKVAFEATEVAEDVQPPTMSELSYNQQYEQLYAGHNGAELNLKKPVPKPVMNLQAGEEGAKKVLFSDVYGLPKRNLFFNREYNTNDLIYVGFMVAMHGLACLAPMTFSWPMVWLFLGSILNGLIGALDTYRRKRTLCIKEGTAQRTQGKSTALIFHSSTERRVLQRQVRY